MKRRIRVLLGAWLVSLTALAASGPPNPYIDKGACPFEGCTYREWVAKRDITLFDRPNGKRQVGRLRAGERVAGLTGEVQSVPMLVHTKANVQNSDKPQETVIPKGEAFYLLHHIGEGVWLSWYRGKLAELRHDAIDLPDFRCSVMASAFACNDGFPESRCSVDQPS